MISTNKIQPKYDDRPQRLTVLTTISVRSRCCNAKAKEKEKEPGKWICTTCNKLCEIWDTKPKTEADMLEIAKATSNELKGRAKSFETRKYSGPMLTLGNMGDRVMNEKRKVLMAKVKIIKFKPKYIGSIEVENPIAMPQTNVIKVEQKRKPRRPKKS